MNLISIPSFYQAAISQRVAKGLSFANVRDLSNKPIDSYHLYFGNESHINLKGQDNFVDLFIKSKTDLDLANFLMKVNTGEFRYPVYSNVVFLCSQALEKMFKALVHAPYSLTGERMPQEILRRKWDHSLYKLHFLLQETGVGWELPKDLEEDMAFFTKSHEEARYTRYYTRQEAEWAVEYANYVVCQLENLLGEPERQQIQTRFDEITETSE